MNKRIDINGNLVRQLRDFLEEHGQAVETVMTFIELVDGNLILYKMHHGDDPYLWDHEFQDELIRLWAFINIAYEAQLETILSVDPVLYSIVDYIIDEREDDVQLPDILN